MTATMGDLAARALASQNGDAYAEGSAIRFCSPQEIAARAPETPPFVWDGYLYRKAVTILASKPKGGKSTLTAALMEAMTARGVTEFLGRSIDSSPIVFVTEEGDSTLLHKLPQSAQIRVLSRDSVWPKPSWADMIDAAARECAQWECKLLVIDTFAFWAQLAADKEKDAGAIGAALDVLIQAASLGDFAVLLIHHSKKGGGEDGEGLRGSSAIAGAVDVILELDRPDESQPRQRALLGLSRYTETPGSLLVERSPEGAWRVIGQSDDRTGARTLGLRDTILSALDTATAMTRSEIEEATGKAWRWIGPELRNLAAEGEVAISGDGVKGSPRTYRKVCREGVQAPAQIAHKQAPEEFLVSVQPSIDGTETETNTTGTESVRHTSAHLSPVPATEAEQATADRLLETYGGDAA